jgi:hypothetical protein
LAFDKEHGALGKDRRVLQVFELLEEIGREIAEKVARADLAFQAVLDNFHSIR